MKLVGIDIGTTTISATVLDTELASLSEIKTVENGSFVETSNTWERIQDVSMIVARAEKLLVALLQQHDDVEAIGLTGQMHGILYTDQNGKCISPLYTWQDGRGDLPKENGITLSEEVKKKTGREIASGYGLLTHLYNKRHEGVPETATCICTIADYFGMVLTGRKKPLMHVSNAASLGFFDCAAMCFDRKELRMFGIEENILPELSGNFSVLGRYKGLPVCIALGDNQAGFLGSVGYQKNTLLVNMGTGGQISMMWNHYIQIPGIETRPFNNGTYLLVGASLCGGRAYAILEKFFRMYVAASTGREKTQYDVMTKLAENIETDSLQVSTLFQGTRQNPEKRGNIGNIGEDNFTPGNLIYGVLRGMAEELFSMYQKMYDGTGSKVEMMIASGNGLRKNPILRNIFSTMFEAELQPAAFMEEAASGAALAASEFE